MFGKNAGIRCAKIWIVVAAHRQNRPRSGETLAAEKETLPENESPKSEIYKSQRAHGIARVVCYSPKHNLTLNELEINQIENLFKTRQSQYEVLAAREEINHILIFENKGEAVGVSNPHPHCQTEIEPILQESLKKCKLL